MTAPRIQFTVHGRPAGQGNLKTGRHGKSYHANDAELQAWRSKVRQAARGQVGGHDWQPFGNQECVLCSRPTAAHAALLGPVRLEAVVTVARPRSVRAEWPISRGTSDWDHYARALGDALTGVAYHDDSQICDGRLVVTYPQIHPDALDEPGVLIRIWSMDGDS